MNYGKQTCELLKSIREKLAQANGIEYQPHECHHEGPCPGTCPLCDQELQWLQQQLGALEQSGAEVRYDVLSAEEMLFLAEERILPEDDQSGRLPGDAGEHVSSMPLPELLANINPEDLDLDVRTRGYVCNPYETLLAGMPAPIDPVEEPRPRKSCPRRPRPRRPRRQK